MVHLDPGRQGLSLRPSAALTACVAGDWNAMAALPIQSTLLPTSLYGRSDKVRFRRLFDVRFLDEARVDGLWEAPVPQRIHPRRGGICRVLADLRARCPLTISEQSAEAAGARVTCSTGTSNCNSESAMKVGPLITSLLRAVAKY